MGHWTDGIEAKVVEAYKAKGVKACPIRFRAGPLDPDQSCCALGALANPGDSLADVAYALGATRKQGYEFVDGFDTVLLGAAPTSRYGFGSPSFDAGMRTAKAVTDAGLCFE